MATYRFRCETDGDWLVEQPMRETSLAILCPECGGDAKKVLSANIQFHGGRSVFHDGVEGTGETGRETRDRWMREFERREGHKLEPVGARWV